MKKFKEHEAEKLSKVTDQLTLKKRFLLVVKRGADSFYFLNDSYGETTRWSYPSNNSLGKQLSNLTTISIVAGKHGNSKNPFVLLTLNSKEEEETLIVGSSSDNDPVVLRLYYPTVGDNASIVTAIERPYEKPAFSYKVTTADKDFWVSEFLTSVAFITPDYTEYEVFLSLPSIKYGYVKSIQGGNNNE